MSLICRRALLLLGVCLLAGGISLRAQIATVEYVLSTVPTTVGSTGDSEVLGSVHLQVANITPTAAAPATPNVLQQAIQIEFPGVSCDNNSASGVSLSFGGSGIFSSTTVTFATLGYDVNNSVIPNTCTVGLDVALPTSTAASPWGLPAVGDWFQLDGLRARMEFTTVGIGSPINTTVIIASSVGSGEIMGGNTAEVATPNIVLNTVVSGGVYLNCFNSTTYPATITVSEPYQADFVDYTLPDSSTGAVVPRPAFGNTDPGTEILLTIGSVPAGVTLVFPASVPGNVLEAPGVPGDHLVLVSTLTGNGTITGPVTSAEVLYSYTCFQATACDTTYETFNIIPGVTGTMQGTTGVITAQAQVVPYDVTAGTPVGGVPSFTSPPNTDVVRPRWSDSPIPAPPAPFITLVPCSTTLLFPWVVSIPGFDTGIVINNTTQDYTNAAALPTSVLIAPPNFPEIAPTTPENGTCTLYYFPSNEAPALYYTSANISSGASWAVLLSNTPFNGLTGYMIARCNFQFGHGYATIGQGTSVGSLTFTEAYLAMVIPDPAILGARLDWNASEYPFDQGESLGH